MGYPNKSNPSKKLKITELSTTKIGSGYQVTCMVNGQSWLKELYVDTKTRAVEVATDNIYAFAEYYPNYEEL
jgi:hypothetical protein